MANHSSGQTLKILWQEPDNSKSYDLDYYLVTIQPGNRVFKTKDSWVSDYFNEGMYDVTIILVVNQCGDNLSENTAHLSITVRTQGNICVKLIPNNTKSAIL